MKLVAAICTTLAAMNLYCAEDYYVSNKGYFIGEADHVTDYKLAKGISDFLQSKGAKSLVDFGCGDGHYVNYWLKQGFDAIGYDGNPVTEEISGGTCHVLDLSKPFNLGKKFDWVISLEVGEHLPKQFERIYIDNLIRHVDKGLILTWAIKGQGGVGHFNEQNNDYIKNIFKKKGWTNDIVTEKKLRSNVSALWFRESIMVFLPPKK
ncbi:MAG: class I SAM-dependent methyltransferase [Simkaniaceae bacterium]|nr:class I SAM-dependent methyltransferase [Simkaniaceae bacterium]